MQLVRQEYQEYMTAALRFAIALATVTIVVGGPVGVILFIYLKGFGLPTHWRRPVGFLMFLAPLAGLITIATVNMTLGWRYRKHARASHARSQEQVLSASSRADTLKTFTHTTFVYPQAVRSSLKVAISLSLGMMVFYSALFFLHRSVKNLTIGIIVSLLAVPLYTLAARMRTRDRKDDYITLTAEGIKFREKDDQGLILWDSVQKIQHGRNAHLINSHNKNIIVWNNIEPAQKPQKERGSYRELFKLDVSEPYVVSLMRQINMMNPAIGYLAPVMSKTFQYVLAGICLVLIIGTIMAVMLYAFESLLQ